MLQWQWVLSIKGIRPSVSTSTEGNLPRHELQKKRIYPVISISIERIYPAVSTLIRKCVKFEWCGWELHLLSGHVSCLTTERANSPKVHLQGSGAIYKSATIAIRRLQEGATKKVPPRKYHHQTGGDKTVEKETFPLNQLIIQSLDSSAYRRHRVRGPPASRGQAEKQNSLLLKFVDQKGRTESLSSSDWRRSCFLGNC